MQGHTQKIETRHPNGAAGSVPTKIGKYEIVEPIGEGGFGMVYKGFDPFIKRHVAIKTCTSPDRELRQRYFREAEIAGRLDHPNIVRIFDFGIEDDTPYLVQEFLAGNDLDHKIEGHEFVPVAERLLYLIHIARGLAYAHDRGVIHRDIKPANIRILDDGTAKIMDFGVAMLQNSETRLTQDGMAVGTAAYLAPEQVEGKTPDHRSDIFSYGALAYELLTGERPFERESISATLYAILNDDPRPVALRSQDCPELLTRLIERSLNKDPSQRPASLTLILENLDDIRLQMRSGTQHRDLGAELGNRAPAVPGPKSTRSVDPPLRAEWAPPAIRMRQRRRWWVAATPAAVLAVLATAFAFVAGQSALPWQQSPPSGEPIVPPVFEPWTEPDAEDLRRSRSDSLKPAVSPPHAALASGPSSGPGGEFDAAIEVPPPPPINEKARLTLSKGWHGRIAASVDNGEIFILDRVRSLELEPGKHLVTYSLETADYRASRTVRVDLQPGEQRTLANPLGRPGRLSVQASLGSPQGLVRIDGRARGSSPVRALRLPPGRHSLQVFAVHDPTLPLAETEVEIRSGRETVITFDLTGQRDLAVRHRE